MKNWIKIPVLFGALTLFMVNALRLLEASIAQQPGSTLLYVVLEWMLVVVPIVSGATLFVEEAFKRPPKPKVVDAEGFLVQLENGRLKLDHGGMLRIAKALDGRLKVNGEAISVKVVRPENKRTGVMVERGIG